MGTKIDFQKHLTSSIRPWGRNVIRGCAKPFVRKKKKVLILDTYNFFILRIVCDGGGEKNWGYKTE